jgi:hypothetical protein
VLHTLSTPAKSGLSVLQMSVAHGLLKGAVKSPSEPPG